jgi:hypothetical protein
VPGNVIVVSFRANELRRNAKTAELRALADFYRDDYFEPYDDCLDGSYDEFELKEGGEMPEAAETNHAGLKYRSAIDLKVALRQTVKGVRVRLRYC